MARAAVRGRLTWLVAEVVERIDETARTRTIVLACPGWPGHLPGQHVDIRLTAEDGYQAQRSYSLATPADGERIAITVERIVDGEVSPYLVDQLLVGDRIELRGPIGGYFVWRPGDPGPLLLVAGGSGIVPLMAILRGLVAAASDVPARLLLSARAADEVIYRAELAAISRDHPPIEVVQTLTRIQPPDWTGYARRVDRQMIGEVAWPAARQPRCYVCGPTGFVEAVASALVDLGNDPGNVLTERFGPTGG